MDIRIILYQEKEGWREGGREGEVGSEKDGGRHSTKSGMHRHVIHVRYVSKKNFNISLC